MKGGRVPIHIMRWAPADYVNDPVVRLALARRDLTASTFYPLFLFHAFMEGGSLPADVEILSAIIGMRPADVTKALAFWQGHGKIHEKDGKLSHSRVSREVSEELAFRELQSERGKLGGRPKRATAPEADEKPPVSDTKSPPCAVRRAPAPTPAPENGRTEAGPPSRSNGRETVSETTADLIDQAARELAERMPSTPVEDWIKRASHIEASAGRPARMFRHPREPGVSEPWAKTTLRKLHELLEDAKRPLPL